MSRVDEKQDWYASRIINSKTSILHCLDRDSVHYYQTKFAPGLLFIYCSAAYVRQMTGDFWGRMFFYRDPSQTNPQPISSREMNNFILVTSVSDGLIRIENPTPAFLKGQRVRVTGGLFEGAEGVIKRIKGDRRLIVSIDGVTAVATCFIRPELLEMVERSMTQ